MAPLSVSVIFSQRGIVWVRGLEQPDEGHNLQQRFGTRDSVGMLQKHLQDLHGVGVVRWGNVFLQVCCTDGISKRIWSKKLEWLTYHATKVRPIDFNGGDVDELRWCDGI
jgi:hypothetical protein